jgi:hypothetical protein
MKVRVIPTSIHAVADYVTGPTLAAAPAIFRMRDGGPSALVPRVAGAGATAYSSMTDYELGLRRWIPMRVHLALDAASGATLAAAPWLFGSRKKGIRYWLPHALVGATEVALAVATKTEPEQPAAPRRFARVRSLFRR